MSLPRLSFLARAIGLNALPPLFTEGRPNILPIVADDLNHWFGRPQPTPAENLP